MSEFVRGEHRIRLWARTQGIPTPPNDRWSLSAALDATDLFLVSVMGLDYFDGGVRVHTQNGWEAIRWDEQAKEAEKVRVDPFENLDDFGPKSRAGQEFIEALERHNASHAQAS